MELNVRNLLTEKFPLWEKLSDEEKKRLSDGSVFRRYQKGEIVHRGQGECNGIMLLVEGQLRPFIVSPEGREITLFRVKSGELCLMTASCLMDAIATDIMVEAVKETKVLQVPYPLLSSLLNAHMELELYLYKCATEKFSDMLWFLQQILFFSADKRVAEFLLQEGTDSLSYTHEEIAKLIGTAREVVSRILKYMEEEGLVKLSRGKVIILDRDKLELM